MKAHLITNNFAFYDFFREMNGYADIWLKARAELINLILSKTGLISETKKLLELLFGFNGRLKHHLL